jgi:DNA transformation protein
MFRISTASFSIQLMTQTPDQAAKAAKQQFRDEVVSHLNQVAPVTARAMFGGYGLYSEGIMFALIADTTVYFKVDAENRADFEAQGMSPFTYDGKGKPITMSYYEIPPAVWQDPPTLAAWVDQAQAAGRRAKRGKRR